MAPGTDECQVRDVKLRDGKLGPVLVTFEHAKLRKRSTDLRCGVFSRENACTVAAVAENGDVVYQGDVRKDEGDLCRNFLAVRNKRTNKVRIYEASSVMLSPSVASNFVDRFEQQDRKEAMYNLQHAFGSKRGKRVVDQRKRMEINVDSVKDKLTTTVNDITIQDETAVTNEDDTLMGLLPPCNREAPTVADVYPINEILSTKDLQSLEKFLSSGEEATNLLEITHMTKFYQALVPKASRTPHTHALLLYAESLIRFCNLKKYNLQTKLCLYSDRCSKRIMKDFNTSAEFMRRPTQFNKDKAIMYAIILGLHIGSFSLDLEPITQSLHGVPMVRVKKLARLIGTRPLKAAGASTELVTLKLPLPSLQSIVAEAKSRRGRK